MSVAHIIIMVVLKVEGLKKRYGNFEALKGVSFELEAGEILGLIGENGAGKSTIIKTLTGLTEPTDGRIEYFGRNFREFRGVKENIGYLPEVDSLYENMEAFEYLSFFASLYGVKDRIRIEKLLDMLDIPEGKPLGEFSKGMQRKVAIARTLIHNPTILIYDEPTGGLDPSTSLFIASFMKELKKDGKAILFSAHNMYYVESVCDKVLILKEGEVVYYGPIDRLKTGKEYVVQYRENGKVDKFTTKDLKELNEFIQNLTASGGKIVNIYSEAMRLEDIYFSIVS